MNKTNNWFVITGGPSTGKTSLIRELEERGLTVKHEAARTVIDGALKAGETIESLRSDEKRFQNNVARLKEKIEKAQDPGLLTFFDRGMQDTVAYYRYYQFSMEQWLEQLMQTARYRKVFLLESLPSYQPDYARTENEDFSVSLQQLLREAYTDHSMEPVAVPALSVEDRAEFILSRVK